MGSIEHTSTPRRGRGAADGRSSGGEPDVEPWDRQRDRRAAALLFLGALVVFLLTADYGAYQMNDTRAASQSSWSLGTRGTLALPEQWRDEIDWETVGADGRLYTNRFPGAILWGAPFYALSDVLFSADEVPEHPYQLNYAPAGVAAAFAAALGAVTSFLLHRRLANRRLAVVATIVLAFGTGVWTVAASALWTHSVTYFTLSLGLLAAADGRHARSGLSFAAAILARPQVAVIAAVVGLWKGIAERRWRPVIVIGLTSSLGLAGIVLYSFAYFGTYLPLAGYEPYAVTAVVDTPADSYLTNIVAALGFPYRGVLVFTPILIVLLPFSRRGWRASPWWVRAGAIAGLVYILLQLRLNSWHGGRGFFGSRLLIETLVLSSPLLLRTWQVFVSREVVLRRLAIALAVASIVAHGLGATIWAYDWGPGGGSSRSSFESRMSVACSDTDAPGC